jgi:hypothetical protein
LQWAVSQGPLLDNSRQLFHAGIPQLLPPGTQSLQVDRFVTPQTIKEQAETGSGKGYDLLRNTFYWVWITMLSTNFDHGSLTLNGFYYLLRRLSS